MTESHAYDVAMRRALELAARGPVVGPNPRVGCVILDVRGRVIAEGWHRGAGTAHAEIDALSKLGEPNEVDARNEFGPGEVDDRRKLGGTASGATAVVTLEPCNHTGRTGPCSEALITAGIARVVYAIGDPSDNATGGAARLREAGIEVIAGVEADAAEAFLRVWLTSIRQRRPFISLKWASSLDGRTAASDGSSAWITGVAARQRVHGQRTAVDAILVGTGTVLADDPSLTARDDAGELLAHQPQPVVLGKRAVPTGAKLRQHPRGIIETGTRDLDVVLADLFARGIRHLYVEGGPTVASAFVAAGLVDEYLIFLAPAVIGGDRLALGDIGVGTIADARRLVFTSIEQVGSDLLVTARPGNTTHAANIERPPETSA